ncbi:MAG: hypothetical protein QM778_07285 [Myxococcales bacterium]
MISNRVYSRAHGSALGRALALIATCVQALFVVACVSEVADHEAETAGSAPEHGELQEQTSGLVINNGYTRSDDKLKPVLMIHGVEATGPRTNCQNAFKWDSSSDLTDKLRSAGFSDDLHLIGYYENDFNCDVYLDEEPANSPAITITPNTSIRVIARLFAWHIYRIYSSKERAVDIVAHSMGGLITRYALYRVAAQDPDFPPYLLVEDVVNTSTPHAGSTPLAQLCSTNTQCQEMQPGSALLNELAANAQQPEGLGPLGGGSTQGGTDWTLLSSEYDAIVNTTSARAMTADHEPTPYPWNYLIGHNGYYSKAVVAEQAIPVALQYGSQ